MGEFAKDNKNSVYTYDAFISYRHTEPDLFAAKTLHREMEAFKLPANIRNNRAQGEKTRINRVFRDREELPLAANLADPITEALENSEFLIVICSKRLPESLWCRKEIKTFIEMHGRDKILAALVEGEPAQSFPEELLYREEQKTQSDGSVISEKISIEPLAADIRGKNEREIKKKIKEEIVRLAAPMFGCAYDELKQRHRERKIKRIIAAAAGVSAVCLAFGSVSTAMAIRINGQKHQIQAQSEQIKEQYWEALTNNAVMRAEESADLLREGDRLTAVLTAVSVLPESMGEDESVPYTPQAEYALSKSMGIYESGRTLMPEYVVRHDTNVSEVQISPDRNHILSIDDAGIIYVWNIEDERKPVLKAKLEDFADSLGLAEQVIFLGNEKIACYYNQSIHIMDLSGQQISEIPAAGGYRLLSDGQGRYIVSTGGAQAEIIEAQNGRSISIFQAEAGMEFSNAAAINQEGNALVLTQNGEENAMALYVDLAAGTLRQQIPVEYKNINQVKFYGDTLYIIHNKDYQKKTGADGTESVLSNTTAGKAVACDLNTGDIKWQIDSPEERLYDIVSTGNQDSDILLLTSLTGVTALHGKDGSVIGTEDLGDSIVKAGALAGTDHFLVYTRGGRRINVLIKNEILQSLENITMFRSNSDNVKSILFGANGKTVLLPYSSTNITVMEPITGPLYEPFLQQEQRLGSVCADPAGHTVLTSLESPDGTAESINMYSKEGKLLWTYPAGDTINGLFFAGEESEYAVLLQNDLVTVLEKETGKEKTSYQPEGTSSSVKPAGIYNQYLMVNTDQGLKVLDTLSGVKTGELDLSGRIKYGDIRSISQEADYAAVLLSKEKKLAVFDLKTGEELSQTSVNTAYACNLFWSRENCIYAAYRNDLLETYQYSEDERTLTGGVAYHELETAIKEIIQAQDDESISLLKGVSYSYLMRDGEVTACIPACAAVDFANHRFFVIDTDGAALLSVPIYQYDELLQEAQLFRQ